MSPEEAIKILECTPSSSEEDIKKAFRRLAMKRHPDRPGGSQEAFIQLSQAYETLTMQPAQRRSITKNMFERFKEFYQGSAEEEQELLSLYKKYKGNLSKIVDSLLLGEDEQEERYKQILTRLIKEHNLPVYPKYKVSLLSNAKRQKRREKEAEAAEALAKELQARAAGREDRWKQMIKKLEDQANK